MRYFFGKPQELGIVSASQLQSFEVLCDRLHLPATLALTREAYHALPTATEQMKAKRVAYLTPATFKTSPSRRDYASASLCNLIALDVDDADEARRIITQRPSTLLGQLGFIAWHTASSTGKSPRIRVLVHTDGLPLSIYAAAVRTIASLLGTVPTKESLVAVQPMFLPTDFAGEGLDPVFDSNPTGEPFKAEDLSEEDPLPQLPAGLTGNVDDSDGPVRDITFLRMPMDGVTVADVAGALGVLDPDCPMAEWIEVAAGIKHQFDSDEGYQLWDAWSSKGKKYAGAEETAYRWKTLKANTEGRAPVTLRSVFHRAQAKGWTNPTLSSKAHLEVLEWLRSESRSGEELLDQGCQRIAKVTPLLGVLERKALLSALKDRLSDRGIPLPLGDLRQRVRQLTLDASPSPELPPWAKGLCYVTSANVFYRHTTDRRFAPEVLDLMYTVPVEGDDKALRPRDFLIQVAGVPQVEALRYDPAKGTKRFFVEENKPFVNTYRATYTQPAPDRAAEAGAIFEAHVANLIREPEYRTTLIDFLAFHVQQPGRKVRWAVVLQGGMGCGKSFIGAAMLEVLGRRNVRKLAASDVMEGNHNGWAYGQQLIILEEVRIAGGNRYAVMDKLKPCISDDEISIRRLYEAHQTVPNICNYLMFTNHHDSLAVHDDDRRYFVVSSPLQSSAQIALLGGQAYFDRLFGMLRENAGGLRSWLENWTISKDFNPDGRAPVTPYLKELAEAAASPLSAAVKAAIEDEPNALVRRDLLSLSALRGVIGTENLKSFSDQALASVLRELGWWKVGRFLLGDARHSIWSHEEMKDPVGTARERDEVL